VTLDNFFKNLKSDSASFGFSFSLWRGYQAYWQLIDDSLYLVGLKGYKKSDEILKKTFLNKYQNGKVFTYWFSSSFVVGKSEVLKWDGIFDRSYFKEDVFDFKNGLLCDRKVVDNYIPVKNGISRLDSNKNHIRDTLFSKIKKLNWKKLSDCDCGDSYSVSITEKGKVGDIELIPYTNNKDTAQMEIDDHKMCIKKFKRKLKNLQFDIVRWHGKPYNEKYYLRLFYTVEGKLESWD
jgi:hypothetical protein